MSRPPALAELLQEGEEIKALAAAQPLTMPVLAVGAGGGPSAA
jgi:hypothetical protein